MLNYWEIMFQEYIMDLFTAIEKRHSQRGDFEKKPVSQDHLMKIVLAGINAPSGKNGQTTSFVIIDDQKIVNQINTMPGANKAIQHAPAMIACIRDKEPEAIYEGYSFQKEDCAASAENMLLAITALGYASVWIDGWLRLENRHETIGRLIGLPEGKLLAVLLPVGVPSKIWEPNKKKDFPERAFFNKWG